MHIFYFHSFFGQAPNFMYKKFSVDTDLYYRHEIELIFAIHLAIRAGSHHGISLPLEALHYMQRNSRRSVESPHYQSQ